MNHAQFLYAPNVNRVCQYLLTSFPSFTVYSFQEDMAGGVFIERKLKETEENYNILEDNLFPRILDVLTL